VESQRGSGWKGPLQDIWSNPPALSRDVCHQIRLKLYNDSGVRSWRIFWDIWEAERDVHTDKG